MPATADRPIQARPPLLLRVAVPGAALAGAAGLLLAAAAAPGAEPVFAAGALAAVGGLIYPVSPRVGAWILLAVGAVTLAFTGFALTFGGSVPWLLVTFWGASATLLAGLMHVIERGNTAELMSGVTVGTVVAVLALSALGLGQYVQANWTAEERAMLEQLPFLDPQVTRDVNALAGMVVESIEPAPGGMWAAYCTYRGKDQLEAVSDMAERLKAHDWVVAEEFGVELTAAKDLYRLRVVTEEAEAVNPGPSKYETTAVPQTAVATYVWIETP